MIVVNDAFIFLIFCSVLDYGNVYLIPQFLGCK